MPYSQNGYQANLSPAYEGMVANSEPARIISRVVETAGGCGFGKAVIQGVNDNGIGVSAAGGVFKGVTIIDPTVSPLNPNAYAQGDTAAVMTKGVVWVLASVAVTTGQQAYIVPASGVFTNVSNSGANTILVGATFDSTAGIGALTKLRL